MINETIAKKAREIGMRGHDDTVEVIVKTVSGQEKRYSRARHMSSADMFSTILNHHMHRITDSGWYANDVAYVAREAMEFALDILAETNTSDYEQHLEEIKEMLEEVEERHREE